MRIPIRIPVSKSAVLMMCVLAALRHFDPVLGRPQIVESRTSIEVKNLELEYVFYLACFCPLGTRCEKGAAFKCGYM